MGAAALVRDIQKSMRPPRGGLISQSSAVAGVPARIRVAADDSGLPVGLNIQDRANEISHPSHSGVGRVGDGGSGVPVRPDRLDRLRHGTLRECPCLLTREGSNPIR